MGSPSLIFCDEPTTGLDSFQAEKVRGRGLDGAGWGWGRGVCTDGGGGCKDDWKSGTVCTEGEGGRAGAGAVLCVTSVRPTGRGEGGGVGLCSVVGHADRCCTGAGAVWRPGPPAHPSGPVTRPSCALHPLGPPGPPGRPAVPHAPTAASLSWRQPGPMFTQPHSTSRNLTAPPPRRTR